MTDKLEDVLYSLRKIVDDVYNIRDEHDVYDAYSRLDDLADELEVIINEARNG